MLSKPLLVSDKQLLRLHYKAQRRNMTLTDVHHKSQIIIDKLISLPEFLHSDVCLLYMPIHKEVDVTSLLQSGKKIVLPAVREGNLQLYSITSDSDLQQGAYGILEPREDCPLISPSEIQLAIIPALAFDVQGYRLGYGKGYYDKLLPQITARKIGVAYEFQIMEQVQFPRETHDRPVEMIITEEQVRVCHD